MTHPSFDFLRECSHDNLNKDEVFGIAISEETVGNHRFFRQFPSAEGAHQKTTWEIEWACTVGRFDETSTAVCQADRGINIKPGFC
ncbi:MULTISPECIES: hypothetical protein [Pseudomonas]|uniref:Uncharacterized protein n=2 Tax=Pseudomonas fluorescens group TaxID=136843 RepID=A0AB36D2T7_9PSED|nr:MULTISPECIES: hypothetical protein [Pseudomonas]MBA4361692.1 hypothetical protein [Pseudomonas sp.]MBU0522263.1 hypothetical protein [Gammaproteobacteria bacterium]MBU0817902.1 hypothetical protein [Gammaproteobacteria bacterium]MBU0843008.1 hypothetical protein [Gammaproteobacteria bacterium]MBU1838789.1 hypothetical protein [Gammaproteobacteria bacterium]